MNDKAIYSVKNLIDIHNWNELNHLIPSHCQRLQVVTERYRNSFGEGKESEKSKTKTKAELLADWNKVTLFLYYEAEMTDERKRIGYLNKVALNEGFNEQKKDSDFDGGPILESIEAVMETFTEPDRP